MSVEGKKNIDKLVLLIRPPHDVRKLPTGMANQSHFKAKDWKSWMLYYSIPVVINYLPSEHLEHYALFVKSIYILHQNCIRKADLDQCEVDLMKFVAIFQCLYGVNAMRYNVHSLLHAVQSVRESGPLWATSAFPYESNILLLKQLVNGPKGIEQQMCKKSLQLLAYACGPRTNLLKM